jgi:Leucine-rich repeat (LRR) protein
MLTGPQKKNLAAVRALISKTDQALVEQGFELLVSLNDPAIALQLGSGIELKYGRLDASGCEELKKRVKPHFRDMAAIYLAKQLGLLDGLSSLKLQGMELSSLKPLVGATALQRLEFYNVRKITDLSPLARLPLLIQLDLGYSELTDISTLADCKRLEVLVLKGNKLESLSSLERFSNLTTLNLDNTAIASIEALTKLPRLSSLSLMGCWSLKDYGPLEKLKGLTSLKLTASSIAELSLLSGMTELGILHLNNCYKITDLRPLQGLKKLRELNLQGCTGLGADIPKELLSGERVRELLDRL